MQEIWRRTKGYQYDLHFVSKKFTSGQVYILYEKVQQVFAQVVPFLVQVHWPFIYGQDGQLEMCKQHISNSNR